MPLRPSPVLGWKFLFMTGGVGFVIDTAALFLVLCGLALLS